ncbi:hypothetical protein J1614_002524 [Plenodomus biglobosus]|nr:hypothetical protein J1614_002524 [Plenodomus biglobosus]
MLLFGLGGLLTSVVLLINAIAILSEDRFLARSTSLLHQHTTALYTSNPYAILSRSVAQNTGLTYVRIVGWTNALEPGFGGARDDASIKARLINLVSSVRTLMRIPLMFINTFMIIYYLVLG